MGLLDSITNGLKEQGIQAALENLLGNKMPEIGNLLKNVDLSSKGGELLEFFKKNGVPDTKEEITELISKFTTPKK